MHNCLCERYIYAKIEDLDFSFLLLGKHNKAAYKFYVFTIKDTTFLVTKVQRGMLIAPSIPVG